LLLGTHASYFGCRSKFILENINFCLAVSLTTNLLLQPKELASEKASARLAGELLRLQKQIGRKRNGQREIKIRHEWVAEMAAMSEFTVSRFLAEWERQGVVSVRHGTIAIQDYKSLKSLCREQRTPSGLI